MITEDDGSEAIAATEALLAADPSRCGDPTLPIFQFAAALTIEKHRGRFETGDKLALLAAIQSCAMHGLPLPNWVSAAFVAAYADVLNCRIGSWDDAFGKPNPKGTHLAALRKRRKYRLAVYGDVTMANLKGAAIDDGLFEVVGAKYGLGKTLTAEMYYEGKHMYRGQFSPLPEGASRRLWDQLFPLKSRK